MEKFAVEVLDVLDGLPVTFAALRHSGIGKMVAKLRSRKQDGEGPSYHDALRWVPCSLRNAGDPALTLPCHLRQSCKSTPRGAPGQLVGLPCKLRGTGQGPMADAETCVELDLVAVVRDCSVPRERRARRGAVCGCIT